MDTQNTYRCFFCILGLALAATGLQAQTKPSTSASGKSGVILVDTDDACHLVIDGEEQGVLKPDEAKKITASFGAHILKCTVEGIPDLAWRKVIEVKDSNQTPVLVSLKALHIQYQEATSQLEKSKEPEPAAALPTKRTESNSTIETSHAENSVDPPGLREGLWLQHNQTTDSSGYVRKESVTVCRTHASDQHVKELGASNDRKCNINNTYDGHTYLSVFQCPMVGGGVAYTESRTVYQGDNASHIESRSTFTPASDGITTMTTNIDFTYLGSCTPDMQPGDIKLSNGSIIRSR